MEKYKYHIQQLINNKNINDTTIESNNNLNIDNNKSNYNKMITSILSPTRINILKTIPNNLNIDISNNKNSDLDIKDNNYILKFIDKYKNNLSYNSNKTDNKDSSNGINIKLLGDIIGSSNIFNNNVLINTKLNDILFERFINVKHSINSDIAQRSLRADLADKAIIADRTLRSDIADKSLKSDIADRAIIADKALIADKVLNVDIANKALKSDIADKALKADVADRALIADRTLNVDIAIRALKADVADKSLNSDLADKALKADVADKALKADVADKSLNSDLANKALKADVADKLSKNIKINLTGDISGSVLMDGSNDITINTKLDDKLNNNSIIDIINKSAKFEGGIIGNLKDNSNNVMIDIEKKIGKFDGGIIGCVKDKNGNIIIDIDNSSARFKNGVIANILDNSGNVIIDISTNTITGKLNSTRKPPTSRFGSVGDKKGDIAYGDDGKIYYCINDYNKNNKLDIWIGIQMDSSIW